MRLLGGIAVALLWASPAPAARKVPPPLPASAAPAWVREAAARTVEGDLAGLDSIVLHDEWIVEPQAAGGVRTTHRHATRVLRAAGMDAASSHVLAYGQDDRVETFEACALAPDGTMRRPDPKDDVADLPFTAGGSTVDDLMIRAMSLPGVVVGSVAAYETVELGGMDPGAFVASFGSVDAPSGAATLTLRVPAGWTMADHAARAGALTRSAGDASITWSAPGLPRLPDEEWPPPDEERLPRVWVRWFSPDGARGFKTWDDVAAWYRTLADPVLAQAGEAPELSARWKPADAAGAEAALREVFRFASRDVRYVAIEMGVGGYRPQAPQFTCSSRYGDCKAKAFLVRSIVTPWGWKAHPVLVRTRDAGRVEPEVPTPRQFNHAIVALQVPDGIDASAWNVVEVKDAGRFAILDPTTESLGPHQLRPDDQGTQALIVLPDRGALVELPTQPPHADVRDLRLEAAIDDNGRATAGTLTVTTSGTGAGSARARLRAASSEEARRVAERRLQWTVPGARLLEHRAEGVETLDGDVTEVLTFDGGRLGQRTGDMILLEPPALALPIPAARLPPPPRTTRLDLGLPEENRVEIALTLPQGWAPDALPKPRSHEDASLSLRVAWELAEGRLIVRGTGRQLVTSVEPDAYGAFRESARRASGMESEVIVLVPTPTP